MNSIFNQNQSFQGFGVNQQRPPGPPPGPPPHLSEQGCNQLPPPPPPSFQTQGTSSVESLLSQLTSQNYMGQSSNLLQNFLSF